MKLQTMNYKLGLIAACFMALIVPYPAPAQVASHAPTAVTAELKAKFPTASPNEQSLDQPVARVNGTVLTGRDLLREMYALFPYARQHGGSFPQSMEGDIRKGALQMIIFEELVYQEALRRKLTVPEAKIDSARATFRKRFSSPQQYQQYLKFECQGSARVLRHKIRRSLLIEQLLKTEVQSKSVVSLAEAKAFYEKNSKQFEHPETFSIQTISIIPPATASADVQQEAHKRADDALRQAKATKNYREFGILAEKLSDDDWHVNMGDRKSVEAGKLPPPIVEAAHKMKPGDVSDLFVFGPNYTIFRLNAHVPAGRARFDEVKTKVQADLQKAKSERLRADLSKRLQKSSKVEVL